jgi:hypothetical protein
MPNPNVASRTWRFFRAGGFDQVSLDSGADLANLDQLDQKLWVALACPIAGLEFDAKTLALIDTDHDGRIRAPELIAATRWLTSLLKHPDDALKSSPTLPLDAINNSTPEGKQLLASAKQILTNLGRPASGLITLEDVSDTAKIFAQTQFNGDGIVPVDAAANDATKAVLAEIIDCFGAETDRSGKPGINQAKADQFFAEAQAYSDWWKKADGDKNILPLGEATAAAALAVRTVRSKVDDYFARCRLASFDARALSALNREEKEYLAFAAKDLTISSLEIAGFPLARIEPGKPLPLREAVNPAWADAMAQLDSAAIKPLLGDKTTITETDWTSIVGKLAQFEAWAATKAGIVVEKLGIKRVREILASKAKEEIAGLIAKDKALEPEASAISSVEQLIRYYRDLYLLCMNFVNFKDFYDRGEPAIFQAGTLYLDQRSCEFTLPVEDAGRHATMAGLAGTYLAYCDCVRKGTGEKRQIVAAFTDGDSENLMIGRNGIFYDRRGRDWDATITKIIDNPISIRQAFWSPYKKFVRMIEEQVAKRAAAAESASTAKLHTAASGVAEADKSKPAEPKKVDVGTVAAMGVAFGAIGAFLTAIWAQLLGIIRLGPLAMVGAFIGLLLLISGPSLILAYIKLRKRNLGPILDANGWAVNAKAKINVPFGKSLTQVAKRPPGSLSTNSIDPFAEKKSAWPKVIIVLVALWGIYWLLVGIGVIDPLPTYIRRLRERHAAQPVATSPAAPTPAPPPGAPIPEAPAGTNALR